MIGQAALTTRIAPLLWLEVAAPRGQEQVSEYLLLFLAYSIVSDIN
jgi:hypothetical protein